MVLKCTPVQAFEIDMDLLIQDLKDHGVVVLVTPRTQAKQLATRAANMLGIDQDKSDEPYLQHLSFEVDDRGWDDCLMYSERADYQPDELREITINAIRDWIAAGEKNYHIFTWDYQSSL